MTSAAAASRAAAPAPAASTPSPPRRRRAAAQHPQPQRRGEAAAPSQRGATRLAASAAPRRGRSHRRAPSPVRPDADGKPRTAPASRWRPVAVATRPARSPTTPAPRTPPPADRAEPPHRRPHAAPRRLAPERRRRGDVVVAVALVVLLGVAALVVWGTSPEVATVSTPDATPIGAPSPAGDVPAGFAEAWRAPSGATRAPVVAGPAVVTGDGGLVVGPRRHLRRRGLELPARPRAVHGRRRVPRRRRRRRPALALYEGRTGWCSELTALRPEQRQARRHQQPRHAPRHAAARRRHATSPRPAPTTWRCGAPTSCGPSSTATCPLPCSPAGSPVRSATYGSTAMSSDRIGVIERCPDAPTDRLTVLTPDGSKGADKPRCSSRCRCPPPARCSWRSRASGRRSRCPALRA